METEMTFAIVEAVTTDGLTHQGMLADPPGQKSVALLWVHGLGSAFAHGIRRHDAIAKAALAAGYGYAAFNTRGHDVLTGIVKTDPAFPGGKTYREGGAGVERFGECVEDIASSIGFLTVRGYRSVILVGHSTGANKVVRYMADSGDNRVSGVVLLAPMSDRYGEAARTGYRRRITTARRAVAAGRGHRLMPDISAFPMTAERYLSLSEPGSPEDVFTYADGDGVMPAVAAIRSPLLVILGGADEHAVGMPMEKIRCAFDRSSRSTRYASSVIEGASHGFDGAEQSLAHIIIGWAAGSR